ncbi:MAG: mechanosensitive ion channel family protein [Desulfovibrionaceae bacterium]|nr:mechanosensitive ion channel family protein [Desulfovibrionaceae bacterium]
MDLLGKLITDIRVGISEVLRENSLAVYATALGIMLAGSLAFFTLRVVIFKIVSRPFIAENPRIRFALLKRTLKRGFAFLHVFPFYWGVNLLKMPPELHRILEVGFYIAFLIMGVRLASAAISFVIDFALRRANSRVAPSSGKALLPIANILLWAIALTFFLDNLGFKVSTIIAGLGIMGVAVGLAGQAILADFFSYLVILIDRPFQIGDFITINASGLSGTIEHIGLKTTHIRAVSGEEIICSNSELTRGFLSNFHDIEQRRARLLFPLPFNLTPAKIEEISVKIRQIVEANSNCIFGRAVLLDFGPWAMNYELVYNVKSADVAEALAVQHKINLQILSYFEKEGITLVTSPAIGAGTA